MRLDVLSTSLGLAEPATVALVVFAVVVFGAVAFVLWLVVTVVRGILRGVAAMLGIGGGVRPRLAGPGGLPPAARGGSGDGGWMHLGPVCPRGGCRAGNTVGARFCRRCGADLRAATYARGW